MFRFFSRRHASKRPTARLGGFDRSAIRMEPLEPRTMLAVNSLGSDVLVNTFTPESQSVPAAAMNGNGDSVVVWQNVFVTGATATNFSGIFAQRFDTAGRPVGDNFRINHTPVPGQINPSVAMDDAGNFVVVWSGVGVGDDSGVYARQFDSSGNPLGDEFRVNGGDTTGAQSSRARSVAMDADGDFVVTWVDAPKQLLLAQRYNRSGGLVGAPISINPQRDDFSVIHVAMDDDGDFAITWVAEDVDNSIPKDIFAQFFAADGTPLSAINIISTPDNSAVTFSYDIARDAQGNTMIVWLTDVPDNPNALSIVGRQFDVNGNPLQGEFTVDEVALATEGGQEFDYDLRVAMNDQGEFVVSWRSPDDSLRGRSFSPGAATGTSIFRFNVTTNSIQREHAIGIDDLGNFNVFWGAGTVTTQDVFMRRALVDTLSTIGGFDRLSGQWYLRNQTSSGTSDFAVFPYGSQGWQPVVGDWNGDGQDTIGVVSPTGDWYLRNTNGSGSPDIPVFGFGRRDWIAVSGDWDGDGIDTIGSYDRNAGGWYLRNSNSFGATSLAPFKFGGPNLVPVVGDWNDDGFDTVGVYDLTSGTWYLNDTFISGPASIEPFQFGAPGFTPVVGDWDNNGTDTVGVVSPDGTWYIRNSNTSGTPDFAPFPFGGNSFAPVAGDWDARSATLLAAATTRLSGALAAPISEEQLRPIVIEAVARWASIDINASDTLSSVDVRLTDLDPGVLGRTSGGTVWIDRDAVGRGWFVDPTPGDDDEFTDALAGALLDAEGGAADGRFDLLSAVAHELGHVLGIDHGGAGAGLSGVMNAELSVGIRQLPTADAVDRILETD